MLNLKIQVVDVFGDDGKPVSANGMIFFKIVEQSGFVSGREYITPIGITFKSDLYPQFVPSYPRLFIRGSDKSDDNKTICVTKSDFRRIQAAIAQLLEIHNKRKFLKTVTFLYANGLRYKINVTKETSCYIEGVDCDEANNCISVYFNSNIRDLQVLKDNF